MSQQLTEGVVERMRVRVHSLVDRGARICAEFVQPSDGGPSCVLCGYGSDVHLVRDLLDAFDIHGSLRERLKSALQAKAHHSCVVGPMEGPMRPEPAVLLVNAIAAIDEALDAKPVPSSESEAS